MDSSFYQAGAKDLCGARVKGCTLTTLGAVHALVWLMNRSHWKPPWQDFSAIGEVNLNFGETAMLILHTLLLPLAYFSRIVGCTISELSHLANMSRLLSHRKQNKDSSQTSCCKPPLLHYRCPTRRQIKYSGNFSCNAYIHTLCIQCHR